MLITLKNYSTYILLVNNIYNHITKFSKNNCVIIHKFEKSMISQS